MSTVPVIAIDSFDGHQPGDRLEVPERQAKQLVEKRLAKMAAGVENKMAQPAANKANPSPAAGRARRSSASPAAQASSGATAKTSARGASARKTAGS